MKANDLHEYTLEHLPPLEASTANSSYGDKEIVAAYCGFASPPDRFIGEWQHGWIWKEYNCHPEMILGSDGLSRQRKSARHFVARSDQVDALAEFGFTDVHAIGLPILYFPKPRVPRIKDSLLVLPCHSLLERNEGWNGEEYRRFLLSIASKFSRIGLCLSGPCIAKGYWSELRSLATDVYTGASEQDRNSLMRLALLFSSYEYVTTNDFGSHVPYAAYFGAKVSVCGPRISWNKVDASVSTFYRNCPECLEIMRRVKTHDVYENNSQFCVEPRSASEHIEWAEWQLGKKHKRAPHELQKLFGWGLVERTLHLARKVPVLRATARFIGMTRSLVTALGAPGLIAALQLKAAATKTTGVSRIWCGWKRRLSLRNGSSDLDVFQQHFVRRELLDIPFDRQVRTVIDLGANIGISVEVFRQLFPNARIVAVELEQRNSELCRANHQHDGLVSVLYGAIWPRSGWVSVENVSEGEWAYRAGASTAGIGGSVPAFTYCQILEMHGLESVDVLKMDIEGAEADVLEAAWSDIFRTTAVSVIEVHDWISGVEQRVNGVIEQAKKRFDLEISKSGEFWVIRNKALAAA